MLTMHFCYFLRKFFKDFRNFSGILGGGALPPGPLRGRPPKVSPRTEILAAPLEKFECKSSLKYSQILFIFQNFFSHIFQECLICLVLRHCITPSIYLLCRKNTLKNTLHLKRIFEIAQKIIPR